VCIRGCLAGDNVADNAASMTESKSEDESKNTTKQNGATVRPPLADLLYGGQGTLPSITNVCKGDVQTQPPPISKDASQALQLCRGLPTESVGDKKLIKPFTESVGDKKLTTPTSNDDVQALQPI